MNKLSFFSVLAGIGGVILNATGGEIETKLQMLVPDGVSLGMRQEELQTLRPKVKIPAVSLLGGMRTFRKTHGLAQAENVVTDLPLVVLYEADLAMPSLTHEYYFVDEKLRAIKGSVSYLVGEKDEETVRQVLGKISVGMTQLPDVKTIAPDRDFQIQTMPVSLWRNEQTGIVLLAFDSPKNASPGGTQVILFDTKYFGVKDFVLEPEDLPKIAPIYDQFRKQNTEYETRMQELKQNATE